ncbi:MAG TPA: hypothetical protein PLM79_17360 [Syntrophobacteraceae bacterium]|nr:hypothetical protein [Syntrophobacteraceae bacterium]
MMNFQEDSEFGPWCERKVAFNFLLEKIDIDEKKACILPSDKEYLPDNEKHFLPFMEVAIFRDSLGKCFYSVNFSSQTKLDKSRWKKIRKAVDSVLIGFNRDVGEGQDLFLPDHLDEEYMEKQREIIDKRELIRDMAPLLRQRYKKLMGEIREVIRSGAKASDVLAKRYGLDKGKVEIELYGGHRAEPSKIALSALLKQLKDECVAEACGLDAESKLKDIVNRKGEPYRGRKERNVIISKIPTISPK